MNQLDKRTPNATYDSQYPTNLVINVKELQHLETNICMLSNDKVENPGSCNLLDVPSEVFQAGEYSKLESLTLVHLSTSETDLSHMLQKCQSKLGHLNLRQARSSSDGGGWKHVDEIILDAPKLAYLQVQIKHTSVDASGWTSFACTKIGTHRALLSVKWRMLYGHRKGSHSLEHLSMSSRIKIS